MFFKKKVEKGYCYKCREYSPVLRSNLDSYNKNLFENLCEKCIKAIRIENKKDYDEWLKECEPSRKKWIKQRDKILQEDK